MFEHAFEVVGAAHVELRAQARFGRVAGRHDQVLASGLAGGERERERAANRPQAAVEGEFADQCETIQRRPLERAIRGEDSDRDRALFRLANGAGEPVDVVALGYRSGLFSLVAAALEPDAFGSLEAPDQIETLKQATAESWKVTRAPEIFCFGLLEEFDIPQLAELAKGE